MPARLNPVEKTVLDEFLARHPELETIVPTLMRLHDALVRCYDAGGKLLLCGNGGSYADAVHIAGELCKSFERRRPIPADLADRLRTLPFGERVAENL